MPSNLVHRSEYLVSQFHHDSKCASFQEHDISNDRSAALDISNDRSAALVMTKHEPQ
jgi:hypothetical protein